MTWNEFKEHVDRELILLGCDSDYEVEYINVIDPEVTDDLHYPEVYVICNLLLVRTNGLY